MKRPLLFNYDQDADVITIEGIKYTGEFFREWSNHGLPEGALFEIAERLDHTFTIRRIWAPKERA